MKLRLSCRAFEMPLKHPFTISRYTVTTQKTVIVSISNDECIGYGEATANPYYNSTVEKIQTSVASVIHIVEDSAGLHPEELWNLLEPHLREDYFALCAIDCAYWDFYARTQQRTLRSFWSNNTIKMPLTNYTIGIDSVEQMTSKIIETPWPNYKIKLGTTYDLEIVSEIRRISNAVLRIDANCGWTLEEAIEKSERLKSLRVEFIEQPLHVDAVEDMKALKIKSVLPVIADESCKTLSDVKMCAEQFNGINIKLMKCGGITPALKMIEKGRELGLQVMAGCMTESSIGISNLVQLAPLLDAIDADGAMLLKNDIANGVTFNNGAIVFSEKSGTGSELII